MIVMAALALAGADPVTAFSEELVASNSATAVLQRRCAEPITADVDRGAQKHAPQDVRDSLGATADTVIAYRSVRLRCGDIIFSRAENWYRPDRLTSEMNALLTGDTPFGAVIKPLKPTRHTISIERPSDPDVVLLNRALVVSAEGLPLAQVVESYTPAVLLIPPLQN